MGILEKFDLSNNTAIVTGASKGLGRAMAVALAEAGADLVITARGSLEDTKQAVVSAGRSCLGVNADLASRDSVQTIVSAALDEFGKIDILVNNAGTIRRAPLTEFSARDWDEVIELNQTAPFFLSQAVAKQMIKSGMGGKIINIASLLSFQGGILVPSYTASKSALVGLTRLLANELAPHHINVNAVAPGYMTTDNTAALRADKDRNRAILERIPAGRWGSPDDLQGIVVFLASQASNYLQGAVINVDGGWLSR